MKLTLQQEDIYFDQLLHPDEPIYNIGARIEIKGNIDIDIFRRAYNALINQHDSYRTVLKIENDQVYTEYLERNDERLLVLDFSSKINSKEESDEFMRNEFRKPFPFPSGSLFYKFILIKVEDELFYLFSVYHHVITDGWGTSLMFQRLVQNYNELIEYGEICSVYDYSYSDYMLDDIDYRKSIQYIDDLNYWKNKFEIPISEIIPKYRNEKKTRSENLTFVIGREKYNEYNILSKSMNGNTFYLILCAFYILISKLYQRSDVILSLPTLNRSKAKYKKTVGLFMGINLLKIDTNPNVKVYELIQMIKNQLKQDYRHQRFPLGKLIKEIGERNESLYSNVFLSYEKQNYSSDFKDTDTKVFPLSNESERYALSIYVREFNDNEDVYIDFNYNLNYYNKEEVNNLICYFDIIMDNISKNPDSYIRDVDYLPIQEKERILGFNNREIVEQKYATLIEGFYNQYIKNKNKLAVFDEEFIFTYEEIEIQSNIIANCLLKIVGHFKEPIGILLKRSAKIIPLLIGIMKSGKSYIPLDPSFPTERIQYIINDSNIKYLISDTQFTESHYVQHIQLQELFKRGQDVKHINNSCEEDTAYIIYTSGSTGKPKGVEVCHSSLLNLLTSILRRPGLFSTDLLFSVTTYSFDISILELFGPLMCGATVYVANYNTLLYPEKIIAVIDELKPDVIQSTPSFFQMLIDSGWKISADLRIWCGGDSLSSALTSQLLCNGKSLWNLYGPTETTIWSSLKHITHVDQFLNIGYPIDNTSVYILDNNRMLLPINYVGNIYIGGKGVSKGYYGKPELTETKFTDSPFMKNEIIYETGDLGKRLDDGTIVFLGRSDNQVKIRGFRIELTEIESVINEFYAIDNVSVVINKTMKEPVLVAFLPKVCRHSIVKLREYMIRYLPSYMIPNYFVEIESVPMTFNGKVDRLKLSTMPITKESESSFFKYPKTETEKKIELIWQEIFQLDRSIDTSEDFFLLGGHSLLAVNMSVRINKMFNVQIYMRDIFEYCTISKLATYIEKQNIQENSFVDTKSDTNNYYLADEQLFKLWIACQNKINLISYNISFCFSTYRKSIDKNKLESAFCLLAMKYNILRTNLEYKDSQLYLKINDNYLRDVEVIDIDKEQSITSIIESKEQYEFNLEKDILQQLYLIKGETDCILFVTHHLLFDGISIQYFVKELFKIYDNDRYIPSPKYQHKDYMCGVHSGYHKAAYEPNSMTSIIQNQYKSYFIAKNNNKVGVCGKKVTLIMDSNLENKINTFLLGTRTTYFDFLLASFFLFCKKCFNRKDIVINTVISDRDNVIANEQFGMFAKLIPIKLNLSDDMSYSNILDLAKTELYTVISSYNNSSFMPVNVNTEIVFAFQQINDIELENTINSIYFPNKITPRYPLAFSFLKFREMTYCLIDFDEAYFDDEKIKRIWRMYNEVINDIIHERLYAKNKDNFDKSINIDLNF